MGFIDLHSHVLPALDDGVKTLAESVTVVGMLGRLGFDVVCCTPHQKVGSWVPSGEAISKARAEVVAALADAHISVELRLGAENFWDELFLERTRTDAQPTYTGERAFLVEVAPVATPPQLEEQLFRLRTRGRLPVLAHPERYHGLCRQPERLAAIGRTAALVVDLGALAGAHGPVAGEAAQRLVRDGLAHACASDVHSAEDADDAGAGIRWLQKKFGDSVVRRLLEENPRRILQGDLPD
ncbi:MAG TPA: CpsB/CapC family capsule biosynthesis tyrosine phosphatase [Polyangia bacterium]|jgi:protein-tyrosine phosphatase|nr:CpsB/CapC family capsule biosynthesis tyrosine phosphatase [Polyangia bacterium]